MAAARAMASGTVSFGLVSIPVNIYATTRASAKVSFHWLHAACGTRVKMPYYCPKHETIVGRDELIKGYEVAGGQYVTFEPEELAAVHEAPSDSISISEFVPAEAVSPLLYDTAYYLGPGKGGGKAYALLTEVMRHAGRVAIARQAVRGNLNVVMLRVEQGVLVMQQLRYADELRPIDEVAVEHHKVAPAELRLAEQLVEQIASDHFDPAAYRNDVRERVLALVERKIEGEEIVAAEAQPAAARAIDLMDALKQSLGAQPTARPRPAKRAPVRRRRRAARRPRKSA